MAQIMLVADARSTGSAPTVGRTQRPPLWCCYTTSPRYRCGHRRGGDNSPPCQGHHIYESPPAGRPASSMQSESEISCIQKLNSVDQYCCLFHIVHQSIRRSCSAKKPCTVCTFHAQEAEVTASGFKTQDAAETRHSAAPTGCASSRARACYGATTNEAD
jgi:hypothetical protein